MFQEKEDQWILEEVKEEEEHHSDQEDHLILEEWEEQVDLVGQ